MLKLFSLVFILIALHHKKMQESVPFVAMFQI